LETKHGSQWRILTGAGRASIRVTRLQKIQGISKETQLRFPLKITHHKRTSIESHFGGIIKSPCLAAVWSALKPFLSLRPTPARCIILNHLPHHINITMFSSNIKHCFSSMVLNIAHTPPPSVPLTVSFRTLNGANKFPVHRMCDLYYTDSHLNNCSTLLSSHSSQTNSKRHIRMFLQLL